jgi:hypothetical protein
MVGHNLLPIFGFSFARCLTSHTGKQPLIILSLTAQSKDCIAASRMRFAHTPLRQHGPRSYPLYLGLRALPREDTGLSPAEAVFGAPIVLPNEFLQNEEISVDSIIKTLDVPAVSLPRHNSSTQRAASQATLCPSPLGPLWRRHSTPSAALRRPLSSFAPWPPLPNHPSQVTG